MLKVLFLCTVLLLAVHAASYHEAAVLFKDFTQKFNKVYASEEEALYRFEVFKNSLDTVATLNARSTSATYGVTKFSDMTPEEFKTNVLMADKMDTTDEPKENVLEPTIDVNAVPSQFDWRNKGGVTPVKNQEQCGSCWAFSTVENIESMWILAGKANASTLRLSPQQVVDCDTTDAGCDGGNPPSAYEYVIGAGGLESESNYPYTAQDGTCQFQKNDVIANIKSWKYATTGRDEKTLQANLVSWGPLSICVDAEYWQYYTGGVMTSWECAWINQLDHCVQLVGYNQDAKTPYWLVRNSWGTSWGVDGYIWLQMFENTCGLANEATSSVV